LAVSALIKGSSQVVDAQKLTASLNTDKSRFLTLCYALATILDVPNVLMQPHFEPGSCRKNPTLSPPFYHQQRRFRETASRQRINAEFISGRDSQNGLKCPVFFDLLHLFR
jgi:hypothetical protein